MTASLRECMACGSTEVRSVLSIEQAPVLCNQLCHSREEALAAAVAPIDLASCLRCGHLYNASFDASRIAYGPDYENALHFSPRFREYSNELIQDLNRRHALEARPVVEVGCGDGDFLRQLCAPARALGFGYDPSYSGPAIVDERVHLSNNSFFDDNDRPDPALLCCRHVLEHVEQPQEFVSALAAALGATTSTALYLEVPNALYTLRDLGIWDIIYEHPSYFCAESLRRIAVRSGFDNVEVEEVFGGQFLSLHAKLELGSTEPGPDQALSKEMAATLDRFASAYESKVAEWQDVLVKARASGRKVAVWGAGSKGSSFLNVLRAGTEVEFIIDVNPAKHGKFVAGTGHRIVAPEALRGSAVETIVLMNPLYEHEVRASLDQIKPDTVVLLA